jgi:hypothetical protein
MNRETTNEYARQCSYAVGMLEGILMKLRQDYADAACGSKNFNWGHVSEAQYLCGQLSEIEDRLWSKGEYAPENVARVGK